MIFYLVTSQHTYTMADYLGSWGAALAERVQVVPFSKLPGEGEVPRGSYIFSDLERLDTRQRALLVQLWERLAAEQGDSVRLLNHPARSEGRFDLLQRLAGAGRNHFNAYRADTAGEPWRYPVFIREDREHNGSRSPLLHSLAEVRTVLLKMMMDGYKLSELLVMEFCDTSDEEGIYRKYAAFRIGEHIVPRHVLFSRKWMLKDLDLLDDAQKKEIHAYCRQNPHEQQLRALFDEAHIDYGRIDYAFKDGQIQVWEINTNPVVMRPPDQYNPASLPFHQTFADAFGAAFEGLDTGRPPFPMIPMTWRTESLFDG